MAQRFRHPDPQAEINAIRARAKARPMTDAEAAKIEHLTNIIWQRRTRLPQQIAATRAKLARLEAQLHG